MKIIKNIAYSNLFKYFSNSKKTSKIKKPLIEHIKSNQNKEFDIYKYFLLPIEERKNYKW